MRGAGTSIAGNALGPGILVVTRRWTGSSRSTRGARAPRPAGRRAGRAQPAAARHGLRVGPDPSTHGRCTIGGMIGNNACGAHSVAWGTTAENTARAGCHPRQRRAASASSRRRGPRRDAISPDPAWPSLAATSHDRIRALLTAERGAHPRASCRAGRAASRATRSTGCCRSTAWTWRARLVGTEGTCALVAARDHPPGPAARGQGAAGARLPRRPRGRRCRAGAAGPGAVHDRIDVHGAAGAGRGRLREGRPARGRRLAAWSRRGGETLAEARDHAQRLAGRSAARLDVAGRPAVRRSAGAGRAVAHPRGRRGLRGAARRRRPGAGPASRIRPCRRERLAAYLRRAARAAARPGPRGHHATATTARAASTCGSASGWTSRAARSATSGSCTRRPTWSRATAARSPASTAMAWRAAALLESDVSARSMRPVRAVQGPLGPRPACSTRASSCAPPAGHRGPARACAASR